VDSKPYKEASPENDIEIKTKYDVSLRKNIILLVLMSFTILNFILSLILHVAPIIRWQPMIIRSELWSVGFLAYLFLNVFLLLPIAGYYHPAKRGELISRRAGKGNYLHITVALAPCPVWMKYVAYGTMGYAIISGLLFFGFYDEIGQIALSAVGMMITWIYFAMFYAGYLHATGRRLRKSRRLRKPKPKRD